MNLNDKVLRKVEEDKKYAEWQLFYLNNLDIFVEEYLQIPLHYFQKQILLDCWKNDIEDIIASRGLSKKNNIILFKEGLPTDEENERM